MARRSTDFDGAWKEALEIYFEPFMLFCFPKIHTEIDWAQGYEFLDKELQTRCSSSCSKNNPPIDTKRFVPL